jgi:hypothetical protein
MMVYTLCAVPLAAALFTKPLDLLLVIAAHTTKATQHRQSKKIYVVKRH